VRTDKGKTSGPRARYHAGNWPAYNAGLISRGNVTMWLDEAALRAYPTLRGRSAVRVCIETR